MIQKWNYFYICLGIAITMSAPDLNWPIIEIFFNPGAQKNNFWLIKNLKVRISGLKKFEKENSHVASRIFPRKNYDYVNGSIFDNYLGNPKRFFHQKNSLIYLQNKSIPGGKKKFGIDATFF